MLAARLGYLSSNQLQELLDRTDQISRMLTGLRKTLERSRSVSNKSRGED